MKNKAKKHILSTMAMEGIREIWYMLMDSSDDDDENENIPDPHFMVEDGESKIIKLQQFI